MARLFVQHYDRMYADKDYEKDIADFLELARLPALREARLLEIGSGTGNQSFRLAKLFNMVRAVEIDPDYAEVFAAKHAGAGAANIEFSNTPIADQPDGHYDAAAAFFHVLNYIDRDDMAGFLSEIARRLGAGAPFVADLWHAEAVRLDPPRPRREEKAVAGDSFRIGIEPALDKDAMTVRLDYDIAYETKEGAGRYKEALDLFLWPRDELTMLLEQAGFNDVRFWDYRAFPAAATDASWRVWMRAVRAP